MVQKVHIVLEDDLDGSEASETVQFGLDGTSYEIDLNEKNAKKLRTAISAYVAGGRKQSRLTSRRSNGTPGLIRGHSTKEVRDWARSNGHKVPERGRIPAEIRNAFEAAH